MLDKNTEQYHFLRPSVKAAIDFFKEEKRTNLHVVEVGLYFGHHAQQMIDGMPEIDKLYGVDIESKEYSGIITSDKIEKLVPMTSIQASKLFPDESLDFVYVDGSHCYEDVKNDLDYWWPKLKWHSVMGGHDYAPLFQGVADAVDGFAKRLGLPVCHHLEYVPYQKVDAQYQPWCSDWWIYKIKPSEWK